MRAYSRIFCRAAGVLVVVKYVSLNVLVILYTRSECDPPGARCGKTDDKIGRPKGLQELGKSQRRKKQPITLVPHKT